MKKLPRIFIAVIAAAWLLSGVAFSPAAHEDISGHWAEQTFVKAYGDGLIPGGDTSMFPDKRLSTAQVLAILCAVLGAEDAADIEDMGLDGEQLYYGDVAKAVRLGIISSDEQRDFDAAMSRQDAFYMLAEAFQLVRAKPDTSALDDFSDTRLLADGRRPALASLVSGGFIKGYDRRLDPYSSITCAEFLTVVYRAMEEYQDSLFGCGAADVRFDGVLSKSALIRSHKLDSLVIDGPTRIGRLTIAAGSGDVDVSPSDGAEVDTLVAGNGGGEITVSGVKDIEVTGRGRYVAVAGGAETVSVSGRGTVVHILPGADVSKIELLADAHGSRVIADGTVGGIEAACGGAVIEGVGYADTLILSRADTEITLRHGAEIDNSVSGASVRISLPSESLPAGDTLLAGISAAIEDAVPGTVCGLVWYVNGVPVTETEFAVGEEPPGLAYDFEYSRGMQDSADISAILRYVTELGRQREISDTAEIRIENYDEETWAQIEIENVLAKVTLGYKGDFTLEWAENNDLEDREKEIWVNAKGFESGSEYLLWINLAHQRVNIFQGEAGQWELIRSCIAGTGRPGRGTSPGIWYTTYKQVGGWTTREYTVKPVVRFREGSGYAFHSRLYRPGTSTLSDPSIGFPVSSGCVRMYEEDIWFIYDNIPNGTTVVVH